MAARGRRKKNENSLTAESQPGKFDPFSPKQLGNLMNVRTNLVKSTFHALLHFTLLVFEVEIPLGATPRRRRKAANGIFTI
ncbi:Hypothetical protein NTJ_12015 [Nesidiocoris tenuis]|uniref:Uncharacterized protein n=1 Tax=Nesidiocoris tenuis TaxID=355587 RepID=A0ABN7B6E1_9HEMI|nr:Hypothetical protein NTJ_12015 [Nesidiocoris tenuis]